VRRLLLRLGLILPTLLGVTVLTFALVHLLPGDPALLRAAGGRGLTPAVIAENRALAGLDRPLPQRYLRWVARSARLDFGRSLADGRPVRTRVAEALPRTAALGLLAAAIAVALGLPLGVHGAAMAGRASGLALEVLLTVAYGVPSLVLGLLLLRAGAPYGADGGVGALLAPALCLGWPTLVVLARQQRAALLSVLGSDYIRTARAAGASPLRLLVVHALPPALLPMVALLGAQVPLLLGGSVIVERIFGLPGIGELGYQALSARDYPMLMALTTVAALLSMGGMLLADLGALLLDPRQRDEPATAGHAGSAVARPGGGDR